MHIPQLTYYEWAYGIAQLSAVFLSLVAGMIAIRMFQRAREKKILKAWTPLSIALVLFTLEEILGALQTFGVYSTPYLTHVVPSFILLFLIAALSKQIEVTKGWVD